MRKMKDSGIEWIGEIPEKWKILRIAYCFSENKTKNTDNVYDNALQFKMGKIIPKPVKWENDEVKNTYAAYTIVSPGDIVINGLNLEFDFITKRVGLVEEDGIITSSYIVMSPKDNVIPKYMNYLLKSYDIKKAFHNMGRGLRKILSYNELKNKMAILPPLEEQQKIADYLDKRCGGLDQVQADIEKSIEEYAKLKQSLIAGAVTKGIRGERPMKDSGVKWIGEIPQEWKVSKIKFSVKWKSVKNHPNEQVLSLYRDYGVIPKDSRDDNYNVTSLDTGNYKLVDIGDLVINKMKAWQGSMGVSDYRGIISPAYHVCQITNPNIYKRYFHYLLRNKTYIPEYTRLSTGMRVGQWDLSFADFINLPFLVPPLEEQKEIAAYLDERCARMDELVAQKRELLQELAAYRQSLIYEYTTGKREVL